MNKLIIPGSPNWYDNYNFICAPDGTVVYASQFDLVVIKPKPADEAADVQIIYEAHRSRLINVVLSPLWNETDKIVATAADDNIVKLWNVETMTEKSAHVAHTSHTDKIAGITFAGADRLVSISHSGFIIVWRLTLNTVTPFSTIFPFKINVTAISTCPHMNWLTAVGLLNGVIYIVDLRRNGRIVHRLRGHDKSIISLAWCPTPYNIYKLERSVSATVPEPSPILQELQDDLLDIVNQNVTHETLPNYAQLADRLEQLSVREESASNYNTIGARGVELEKYLQCSVERQQSDVPSEESDKENVPTTAAEQQTTTPDKKKPKKNPWGDMKFVDDDEVDEDSRIEEIYSEAIDDGVEDDFLKQCSTLKNDILKGRMEGIAETDRLDGDNEDDDDLDEEPPRPELDLGDVSAYVKPSASLNDVVAAASPPLQEETPKAEEVTKDYLLASSCKGGRHIVIWRAGSDGLKQDEILLPGEIKKRGNRNPRYNVQSRFWITLNWSRPFMLLSSSCKTELLKWTLCSTIDKNSKKKAQCVIIHFDHKNHDLFSIATPMKLYPTLVDVENSRNESLPTVWTTGHDRWVLNTELDPARTRVASYPTLAGQVTAIAASPLDPNHLAIAVGEHNIRIFDLSKPHTQCIIMTIFMQKSMGKVSALAWHPSKENILAMGTAEGRVGLIETGNVSKAPTYFCMYSTSTIHCIEWAPIVNCDDDTIGLFVNSAGKLYVYDEKKPLEMGINIDMDANLYVNLFTWKADYSKLAVGFKDGSVSIFSSKLQKLCTFYGQQQSVQCLQWHPLSTVEDNGVSPFSNYLAVGTASPKVLVYDCTEVNSKTIILEGHKKLAKALAWSPHRGGRLVTSSADAKTLVWDVETKTVLATYHSHPSNVICSLIWSPLDPDLIISGTKENNLIIWNVTENPANSERNELFKRNKITYLQLDDEESSGTLVAEFTQKQDKPKRQVLMPRMSKAQGEMSEERIQDCVRIYNTHSGQGNKFPERLDCKSDDVKPSWIHDAFKLFGSREDVADVVGTEQIGHENRIDMCLMLDLFKGNAAAFIKFSIAKGQVTPLMVGVASTVSHSLWLQTCAAYANKLKASPRFALESVAYSLACHKTEEAIETLCEATLYREALTLAKLRLPEDDPTINDIMTKWATSSVINGNLEVAAQNFIRLGKLEEAAKILLKRNNLDALEFALFLANECGNSELAKGVEDKINLIGCDDDNSDRDDLKSSGIDISSSRYDAIAAKAEADKDVRVGEEDEEDIGCSSVVVEK